MGLIRCIPRPDLPRSLQRLIPIPGQVCAPDARPTSCGFGPRCDHFVAGTCDRAAIPLLPAGAASVRCVRAAEIGGRAVTAPTAVDVQRGGDTILAVSNLDKVYPLRGRTKDVVRANHGLSFDAAHGQTLAVVGESGCGKSTYANVLMGLTTASGGEIMFETIDLAHLPVARRPAALLRDLQMVFQNPDETLNPSYAVGRQIARAVRKLGVARDKAGVRARVQALLGMTHRLPEAYARRRPSQLSGGQKQRVGIARAFARRAETGGGGRASLRLGRLGAGSDHRVAVGHPAHPAHHADHHQPRPWLRALYRRPRRGHVPGPGHGGRCRRERVRTAVPSVHRGAVVRRANA